MKIPIFVGLLFLHVGFSQESQSTEGIAKLHSGANSRSLCRFGFFANRLRPKGYVDLRKTKSALRSSNLRREASIAIPSTHFYFVRHGQTHRNQQGERISGQEDGPIAQLNDAGRMQADLLGKQLSEQFSDQISWIYTSPLGRAMETATIIAGYFPKATLIPEPRFMEYNHGKYDTIHFQLRNQLCLAKYEEIEREGIPLDRFYKWKLRWSDIIEYDPNLTETPLEGIPESAMDVFDRVTNAIEELSQRHPGQKILVVSHAGVIKTMALEAENREKEGPLPMYFETTPGVAILPGNCSVTHFEKREKAHLLLIKSESTHTETALKKH